MPKWKHIKNWIQDNGSLHNYYPFVRVEKDRDDDGEFVSICLNGDFELEELIEIVEYSKILVNTKLDTKSLSVRNTCEWTYSFSGTGKIVIKDFHTECKHTFHYLVPIVGKEEIYKFCPYCGKRIVEKGIKDG